MNLIMANDHLLPRILTTLTTDTILLTALTPIIIFIISKGVGRVWERFRVKRQIQEAKMMIWKWIKFRYKSYKPDKVYTRI